MALFSWKERPKKIPKPDPRPGDRRIVNRFVIIRKIAGEWRALGHELIEQEYVYYHHNEDGTYLKWKAVAWVDPPPSITLKGRS